MGHDGIALLLGSGPHEGRVPRGRALLFSLPCIGLHPGRRARELGASGARARRSRLPAVRGAAYPYASFTRRSRRGRGKRCSSFSERGFAAAKASTRSQSASKRSSGTFRGGVKRTTRLALL